MGNNQNKVVLIIRDGWGQVPEDCESAPNQYNAILNANTPIADDLFASWPSTLITTSGKKVGLPIGVMGNSEVGHQNIGAGRIVAQELMRLNNAIEAGEFKTNEHLATAISRGNSGHTLHLVGLVSDGCIHSDIAHLYALLDAIPNKTKVMIHVISDGRDCSPTAGLGFVEALEERLVSRDAHIATVMGRYYAMDRDHRWERISLAFEAMTGLKTTHPNQSHYPSVRQSKQASCVLTEYYESPSEPYQHGDEFVVPTQIIGDDGLPIGLIQDGDAVVFFNYRGDRPRELTRAFVLDDAAWSEMPRGPFVRGRRFEDLFYVTLTNYERGLPVSAVAFDKPEPMKHILGAVLEENNIKQFRCAETEKFPHVTFFFNDYREAPFEGESRLLVPSPTDITTYDQKPEMSAHDICMGVLDEIKQDDGSQVIVVNFANGDMVGHTGNYDAIVRAVEVVDTCCGDIINTTLEVGGSLIITADHGNAEKTWNTITDSPDTAHTTFDVPLHIVGDVYKSSQLRKGGILGDIAPTILSMVGIEQPKEMTGTTLICD